MSSIEATMINADVLSSSSDSLRVAMGSFWESDSPNPLTIYYNFNQIQTHNLSDSFYLSAFYSQKDNAETGSFIFPSISMPARLVADSTKIRDDNEWKAIMIGGTWGNRNYQGIFTNGVFDNLAFNYNLPYPKMDANTLDGRAGNVITINYNYRQYLQQYQLASFDRNVTEHTLYNHYVAADLSRWQNDVITIDEIESGQLYAPELINYITREGTYKDVYQLNDFNNAILPYSVPVSELTEFGKIRTDNTYLSKNYLTSAFVQTTLSSSTANWVGTRMRNMIFDTDAVGNLFNSTSQPLYECAPYDININWQSDNSSTAFLEQINNNNFSSRFIKTLYSAFAGDIEQLFPSDEEFVNSSTFLSSSGNSIVDRFTATSQTFRFIEYDKLLAYCRNTYDTTGQNNNCMFVGEKNMARAASQAEDSKFRFFNSKITTRTINNVVNLINSNSTLFNSDNLNSIYTKFSNYSETLAYRIEKIGGLPSTDARTQNVLQNFWLMNSADIDTFDFHDTQVKYDRDYTYTVYAYVLVVGTKYSTSDLVLSRDLGCESTDGTKVGLEMYDPSTGNRAAELFNSNIEAEVRTSTETGMEFNFSYNYFDPRTSDTEYGETYQIFSQFPYVADYMMKYQPVMKIVEVPLYSKTLRVLDNPGNRLQTIPYQIDDDSQRIGFKFDYEFFTENHKIMSAVTTADQTYINNYLHANDLTINSILENETIANPRTVQIFRLNQMPTSITNFEGNLLTTIDLSIQNDNINTNRETYYEDTVATNQKYYYLFRVLNQQGTVSHLSEIYEAQLVSDGGYKYAVFNVINEKELESSLNIDNLFNGVKKIFQLQPNIGQLTLETTDANFDKEASSQIENVGVGNLSDLIWDKTFKIRLTSKKTSRKIDLNVTYRLNSE